MAQIQDLRNPPITEAVIDFRVVLPEGIGADQLREAKQALASTYPKSEEPKGMEARVAFQEGHSVQEIRDLGFQGVWLKTADELTVAQFRPNGFTVNRLKPYQGWDRLLPEAMRLWDVYVQLTKPLRVTRLAVRYINNLPYPGPGIETEDYFVTGPRLPPSVPEAITGFTTRVGLIHPDRQIYANVIQVFEVRAEQSRFLFDIDVFKVGDFGTAPENLVRIFEMLRTYRGEIFFSSLTEKYLEMFK